MDLVFSDIHADIDALELIVDLVTSTEFKKEYGEISRILNLGDVLERGTHPKQVLEKLSILQKNYPLVSVMGNHDEAFLYGRRVSGSSLESLDAHSSLTDKDLEFFQKNKDDSFGQQQFVDKKNRLICVHGGPLDSDKITPPDAGQESWLYQKTWQRLSEEDFEFFSYAGFHYKASSAFSETKTIMENSVILCGHQHLETALRQDKNGIKEIFSITENQTEKLANFLIEKKEFEINPNCNYFIRVGLGGPEGYYGVGAAKTHFGIVQYNPKKVILFNINP